MTHFNRSTHPTSASFAVILGLLALGGVANGDQPELTSWKINTTGETGVSLDPDMNAALALHLADVQSVYYTESDVYVSATGIPSYPIGPYIENPAVPTDVMAVWRLPRMPVPETGTTTTLPLGPCGVFVNGVALYDQQDGRSWDNRGIWVQNAGVAELLGFDDANGHPSPFRGGGGGGDTGGEQPAGGGGGGGGQNTAPVDDGTEVEGGSPPGYYHHHIEPNYLRDQMGDDGSRHSPVLGYAFDGFPVYGPYGYSDPNDPSSGLRLIKSSYRLRSISDRSTLPDGTVLDASEHGPPISDSDEYRLGYYQQDYEFVEGLGDLNKHNVRFTVTPEYPEGTYAYYVTVDDNGDAVFPYMIGDSYFGVVAQDNLNDSVSLPGEASEFSVPISGATPLEGEWFRSDWYGDYYLGSYPWMFHEDHGWQFPAGNGSDALWLYETALGWLYMGQSSYPWLFNNDDQDWWFYQPASSDPRWFFDASSQEWQSVD